jgi:predicted nucleic acid-binding protein
VAGELLLDTGALVTLLDRSQKRHGDFVEFFEDWSGPVVSTEAVLTESTHRTPEPGERRVVTSRDVRIVQTAPRASSKRHP